MTAVYVVEWSLSVERFNYLSGIRRQKHLVPGVVDTARRDSLDNSGAGVLNEEAKLRLPRWKCASTALCAALDLGLTCLR